MKIYERLDNETIEKLGVKKPIVHQPKERLSFDEWEDIMGVNRQVYKRVKGRVKSK